MTAHQINEYNSANGTNYRFAKGIKWFPVIFFKKDEKKISREELMEKFPDAPDSVTEDKSVGSEDGWNFIVKADGTCVRTRNVLKYYNVADRKFFVDENGNCLPSKIETGEVEITLSDPKKVMQWYIDRSGVRVMDTVKAPSYVPALDIVYLNKHMKSEKEWFSTAFHELGHSTGHPSRLARKFAANVKSLDYAKEECVAEICASLCCAECGIYELNTSLSRESSLMSEINKLLWFLLALSINGLISIIISQIDSKRTLEILFAVFSVIMCLVCTCWVFFDFWK